MRISLDANPTAFAKQVAGLRSHLNSVSATTTGQSQVSARMMLPVFLPYLHVLRTELRDDIVPAHVMTGAADLLANIAKTTVQSLIEADPLTEGQTVEQLLTEAMHIAMRSIAQDAETAKLAAAAAPAEGHPAHPKPALKVVRANGGDHE